MQLLRTHILLALLIGAGTFILATTFVPLQAHAQGSGLTDDQVDAILDLLESFDADASVVSDVEGTLQGTSDAGDGNMDEDEEEDESENGSTGAGMPGRPGGLPEQASDRAKEVMQCLQIGRILRAGHSGQDVQNMQEFLKAKGHFDHDEATGYFGRITREAVQEFQEEKGIVSSGSPETTGFGQVGPRTRGALSQASCLSQGDDTDEEGDTGTSTDETGNEDEEEDDEDTATSTDDGDDDTATSSDES